METFKGLDREPVKKDLLETIASILRVLLPKSEGVNTGSNSRIKIKSPSLKERAAAPIKAKARQNNKELRRAFGAKVKE